MANEVLKLLDTLLQDYEDQERDFYLSAKMFLSEGISYQIEKLVLSDKQEKCRPLNLIKPFFNLFYTNDKLFYRAKYKKRKILTSFRGNLQNIPLCMDDDISFQITQQDRVVFKYEGVLNNLINEFELKLNPTKPLLFKIKLIKTNESRQLLEREIDSNWYINNILESFLNYCQSSRFVVSKSKQSKANHWFSNHLNLKNFDIMNLTMSHLKNLSKDVLILEKMITSLRYGKLSLLDNKEISLYKTLMKENINKLENDNILIFYDTVIIINFKKI